MLSALNDRTSRMKSSEMSENIVSRQEKDLICITRTELEEVVAKAVKTAVQKETKQIGEALASDLQEALRAIDDEIGRFATRLKRLEAWQADHDADAAATATIPAKVNQPEDKAELKTTKEPKNHHKIESEKEDICKQNNVKHIGKKVESQSVKNGRKSSGIHEENGCKDDDRARDMGAWTRVVRKKKKSNLRKEGAILIGGQNVLRIKAAAMDEFNFDQNVSFVNSTSEEFERSLQKVTQKSKAREIEVVIHLGSDDATRHSVDHVLGKLTNMVNYARQLKNVKTVSVCTLEERRDAGPTIHEGVKTINTELAQLCVSTGSTLIDLRPRLEETVYRGLNRTGILYTFEGARNVAQHILGETAGFLD